jgi:hypothetical protein
MPLWLFLLLVVFTVLGIIEVIEKLAQAVNWSVQSLLNVLSLRNEILRRRMRKFPEDMKQPALESEPFTEMWRRR